MRPFLTGEVPAGHTVPGFLILAGLRVRSLPPVLTVEGSLDLRRCERLREIGVGLHVQRDLDIGGTTLSDDTENWETLDDEVDRELFRPARSPQCPIPALPAKMRVDRNMTLSRCSELRTLPADLQVHGSLTIVGCSALESLPEGLTVGGDLSIVGGRRLQRLPAGLRVGGSLNIRGTRLAEWPEGLSVARSIRLWNCSRLTSLPDGLTVAGDLELHGLPLERIPSGMRVGGDLTLRHLRHVVELPAPLDVGGDVIVRKCSQLAIVPQGMSFGGNFQLRDLGALVGLPEGLQVRGELDLTRCAHLERLPSRLRVGHGRKLREAPHRPSLILDGCAALRSLPDDLDLHGALACDGSGLTRGAEPHGVSLELAARLSVRWAGMTVPGVSLFHPQTLAPEDVLCERNAELRRFMLERVGLESVLSALPIEVLDVDEDPGGERRLLRFERRPKRLLRRAEHWCFLDCRCPSTGRRYLLRVPPETRSCHAAAAWMAGFDDPQDYRPIVET